MEPAELNKYLKLTASDWPQTENGILVAAFAGWNDAGESATKAVQFLSHQIGAVPFATIDPEEFYVFTDTRPRVRLIDGTQRELQWPTNQFLVQPGSPKASQRRSIITLAGVEPNLKWRTFANVILEVVQRCNVREVVLLGALVAPVPHTRAVPLTGYTTNPTRQERLQKIDAHPSHYEGPTGILGVLNNDYQEQKINCTSLWAAAPSYLSANPNWKVTTALLRATNQILDLNLDLGVAENRGRQFEKEVSDAVERDSDVQNFVRTLESRYDHDEDDDDDYDEGTNWLRSDDDNELPSAEILIQELEQQLGLRRPNDEDKNR